jgi:hypothetical protein
MRELLPISDCRFGFRPSVIAAQKGILFEDPGPRAKDQIGNWQSEIGNTRNWIIGR